MLRRLPYGANYLDWTDLPELREAFRSKVLFRYQTPGKSFATRLEELAVEKFGVSGALAVPNCTQGLRLAVLATQPRPGDLIYIPAMTFVAVAGAALSCGLIPILTDVDETLALDALLLPDDAERVVVAHMEGAVSNIPARKYVIEDAAQALGARHNDGTMAGAKGFAGVFSFHHNKILTSGEGGLILTNNPKTLDLLRRYHDHGSSREHGKYPTWTDGAIFGENLLTSETTACIQLQQFRHLERIKAGLERGYEIALHEISQLDGVTILPRRPGDLKLSVRILAPSPDVRARLIEAFLAKDVPYWTLDRYFLPTHPVLRDRKSIYRDAYPWNLAPPAIALSKDNFAKTKDLLSRIVCPSIAPETTYDHQHRFAKRAARVIGDVLHARRPAIFRGHRNGSGRDALLYVDDRPISLTKALLARNDVQPVLLRFSGSVSDLSPAHLRQTEGTPSFLVDEGSPVEKEAVRFRSWAAENRLHLRGFCNPSEPRQAVAHRFARAVGLPSLTPTQISWTREKLKMKERLKALGFAVASHTHCKTADDAAAFLSSIGRPIVVKPDQGYACLDAFRIDRRSDLEKVNFAAHDDWIAEELIGLEEFECCALLRRGRVLDAYLSYMPQPPLAIVDGAMNANISAGRHTTEFPVSLKSVVQRIVFGLALDTGYLHMEFFYDGVQKFIVSELALRVAGCEIAANHGYACGFDIFGAIIDLYLGRAPKLRYTKRRFVGDLILPGSRGVVADFTPPKSIERLPGVIAVRMFVHKGDRLNLPRMSHAGCGVVHVEGSSRAEVEERMARVLAEFHLTVST